jgi:penicillin-binding protein 1A
MSRVHQNLENKDFPMPADITSATVCKKSGKLPVEGLCDSDPRGSMVETEFFAAGTVPTEVCDHHVKATICSASGLLAGPYCPESTKETGVYIVGGSSGSADAPYLLSDSLANSICDVHTSNPTPAPTPAPSVPSSAAPSGDTKDATQKSNGSLTPADNSGDKTDNTKTDNKKPNSGTKDNSSGTTPDDNSGKTNEN